MSVWVKRSEDIGHNRVFLHQLINVSPYGYSTNFLICFLICKLWHGMTKSFFLFRRNKTIKTTNTRQNILPGWFLFIFSLLFFIRARTRSTAPTFLSISSHTSSRSCSSCESSIRSYRPTNTATCIFVVKVINELPTPHVSNTATCCSPYQWAT